MHELIRDITFSILFAWVLGLGAHFFRQPLILAYLVAGFVIGPYGVGWVKSQESISTISELGLIFMLFMIGLEIDLKKIIRAGRVILFAAGGQLIGACVIGLAFFVAIGLSLGGGKFDALYLTVACALSLVALCGATVWPVALAARREACAVTNARMPCRLWRTREQRLKILAICCTVIACRKSMRTTCDPGGKSGMQK